MIICPICNTANHHLRVICSSCGGYVQHKVDNLNLFETIWKTIESPHKAFHSIAIAQHKNYGLLLGALAGFSYISLIYWCINAGDIAGHLVELVLAGIVLGPVVGVLLFFLHLGFTRLMIRSFGYSVTFRNLKAVIAYTLFPLIVSSFIVLPLELITFGVYLFTKSPNPFTLLPNSAYFLFTLDALLVIWFISLHIIGIKVLLDIKFSKSLFISLLSMGISVLTVAGLISLLPIK